MAHHIYHTRGAILESRPSGESNRFYKIFTEELGLVGVSAQSVREGRSKLRYVLQDSSLVTVDLVRGKEVWRIVSAGTWNPLVGIKKNELLLNLLSQFYATLARLLHGEGRDEELFKEILGATEFLEKGKITPALSLSFETLTTLRVLVHLGYLDPVGFEPFLETGIYTNEILIEFDAIKEAVLPKINHAFNASHL